MKCCNNHDHNGDENLGGHNHKNHLWMMLLCCGVPLAIIALLAVFGGSIPSARSILLPIIPFLCPVMMLLMMLPMLLSWRKGSQGGQNPSETERLQNQ